MRQIFTISLLFSTIRLATPLVWAAIGGLYSERSGVINVALEGLMLAGAFTAAAVTFYAHSPWVGLGAAMLAGALVAYLLALLCIRFKANEVVTGTGINILFLGLPAVLSGALFLSSGSTPQIPKEQLLPTLYQLVPGVSAVAVPDGRLRDLPPRARRRHRHGVRPVSDADRVAPAVGRGEPGGRRRRRRGRESHPLHLRGALGRARGHRRRVPVDRAVVALHPEHDGRPRVHRAGGADLRQVAPGADDARVPAVRVSRTP